MSPAELRRLLELAAKAMGSNIKFSDGWFYDKGTPLLDDKVWKPHEYDCDSRRLQVKARLNLNFEEWDGVEYACAVPCNSHQGHDEVIGDDADCAARLAVLRAAAAIGEAMP